MSNPTIYSPGEVVVTLNAVPITARADTFFEVEMNAPKTTMKMDVDGGAAVNMSKDNSGKITVTVTQGSESNDLFMAAYNLWVNAKQPAAIMAKDLNGRSLHVAEICMPEKLPKSAYGKEGADVAWVFLSPDITNNIGGSNLVA